MALNDFNLYYCPICALATIDIHPENELLVKCGFCGYTNDIEGHRKELKEKLLKQRGD